MMLRRTTYLSKIVLLAGLAVLPSGAHTQNTSGRIITLRGYESMAGPRSG